MRIKIILGILLSTSLFACCNRIDRDQVELLNDPQDNAWHDQALRDWHSGDFKAYSKQDKVKFYVRTFWSSEVFNTKESDKKYEVIKQEDPDGEIMLKMLECDSKKVINDTINIAYIMIVRKVYPYEWQEKMLARIIALLDREKNAYVIERALMFIKVFGRAEHLPIMERYLNHPHPLLHGVVPLMLEEFKKRLASGV